MRFNRSFYFGVLVAVILALAVGPTAFAQSEHMCEDHAPTIESLHHCVMHAAAMDHITNPGIAQSLLQKLDAALAARDRGATTAAVNLLQAFIREVQAQSGKHIDADHAAHMIMHANEVIAAL